MRRRNPNSHHSFSNHSGEAISIWRDLHQRLNQLAAVQGRSEHTALQLAKLGAAPDLDPTQLDRVESLWRDTNEEDAILDICLERLGILIALREAPPDPPLPGRSTKKRRLEPPSAAVPPDPSGSPLPASSSSAGAPNDHPAADSPASHASSPAPFSSLPTFFSQSSSRSQIVSRASTPLSDTAPLKRDSISAPARAVFRLDRRITLRDQLPLLPGRLVAFRRPKKPSEPGAVEEWIMAKVVKCISGDKNRYEVEDVDEEGRGAGRQTSWNTTLKSVIPLPAREHPESYPLHPLAPGTPVLGLYPETTSFYRGTIKSGPSERGRKYKVFFEDDEETGAVPVVMEHIVPIV